MIFLLKNQLCPNNIKILAFFKLTLILKPILLVFGFQSNLASFKLPILIKFIVECYYKL